MRTIKKGAAGNRNLIVAQRNNGVPVDSESAARAWSNFTDHNDSLCYKLLIEQYGLCCYTELNLSDLRRHNSVGAHFEHEQPKSIYPNRTFDESNILRCVLSSDDLSVYSGNFRFGGHYKDNNPNHSYNPNMFISPQMINCLSYFSYLTIDGTILPNANLTQLEAQKAQFTIDILNLNAPFLKAERERWLKEIDEIIDDLINRQDVHALENLAECELTLTTRSHPDLNKAPFPQLQSFHSATRALFGALGERVIQQHCPQID
ncbi:TIGR02646 family protein [Enterovibrio makurazakiensis]|uniref:retron system putative HNH endonuclease n=1 Tax=Enterovibrio makurazakiensis TaxID=2910232 RepID=UPI003D1F2FA0